MVDYHEEWAVLNKVLLTKDLKSVVNAGVDEAFFEGIDTKEVFEFITDSYARFQAVPSRVTVKQEFPAFVSVPTKEDTLPILIDRLREKAIYRGMREVQKKAANRAKVKPSAGLTVMQSGVINLSNRFTRATARDARKETGNILAKYERIKESGGIIGIPTPWDELTRVTKGAQPGVVKCYYGHTGTMKTFLLLHEANHCHKEWGQIPLFLTKEMSVEQILWRYAGMLAKVDYEKLNSGALSEEDEKKFKEHLEQLVDDPPFWIDTIVQTGPGALLELQAKIDQYGPDRVFLDGMYFLADNPSDWGQMAVINNGIKQCSLRNNIAFDVSTQRNYDNTKKQSTDSSDAGDVGYGKSLAQAVDYLIRVVREKQHIENKELLLVLPKARESLASTLVLHAKPCADFSQKAVISIGGEDYGDSTEGDGDEDEEIL